MTRSQLLLLANGRGREATPLRAWFAGWLGLDLRSLAVYRIGMGSLLIADLILRSRDLFAHYTDDGILPRHVNVYRPSDLMLHQLSGSAWYEAMLFIIAGVFALMMLVGYWTRLATCVSWFLLASVQARIPLTNDGAQDLMRVLMFWNMFLPLGACYSVDAALNISLSRRTRRIVSVATVALGVQLCLMYWMSYRYKTSPEWRTQGSAVYYALSLDMLTTSLGQWLREFPVFLRGLTYGVIVLEAIVPLLFYFPWPNAPFRTALIVLLCGMHLGFIFCMWIEIFPWLCIVAWMAFVPSMVWDWLGSKLRGPPGRGLALYYDQTSGWQRRKALLLRTFLILPQIPIRRLAVQPGVTKFAKEHRSGLVLTDLSGGKYGGLGVLAEMIRQSPITGPLGRLIWRRNGKATPASGSSQTHRTQGRAASHGASVWLEILLPTWRPRRPRVFSWTTTLVACCLLLILVLTVLYMVDVGGWALARALLTTVALLALASCLMWYFQRNVAWCMRLAVQVFAAVWVVYILWYNFELVNIRSFDFSGIPRMVRHPDTFPDAFLSSDANPAWYRFNFTQWLHRPAASKTYRINNRYYTLRYDFYELGRQLRLDQRWAMFSPNPLKDDGWFVLDARMEDGTRIDLWANESIKVDRDGTPAIVRPDWPAHKFPNYRWFKFMENFLSYNSNSGFHPYIGRYFFREWDREHPHNHIIELNIYFMAEISQPPYVPTQVYKRHVMRWCRNDQCK